MLRFTKRHTVSLAKGLQQDRFLPCCQEKQLKPLLYQQCQCHFTDKNIVQTEEEWQNLHSCKLQGKRSQEVPLSLMVKNLEHLPLLFSSESTIHRKPWSDAQNCAIPPLLRHRFLWAAHPLPGTQGKNLSWQRTCPYNTCQFYDNSQNREVNESSQNSINQIPHYTHREGKEMAKSW